MDWWSQPPDPGLEHIQGSLVLSHARICLVLTFGHVSSVLHCAVEVLGVGPCLAPSQMAQSAVSVPLGPVQQQPCTGGPRVLNTPHLP